MIKINNNLITGKKVRAISEDTVNISSGSVVIDNKWVSYKSINYKIRDYIKDVVVSPRTRFFLNRSYSVMLVIGIDSFGTIRTAEGTQVKYSSNNGVPVPAITTFLPFVGIILVQDGTNDLNSFKSITDSSIVVFSGAGNIKDKNIVGTQGMSGIEPGDTGLRGVTGVIGQMGPWGITGHIGETGIDGIGAQGEIGEQGLTGVSWTIHFPFQSFS